MHSCGFGRTFPIKLPKISGTIVQEKTVHIDETYADILVGSDMVCLMNIKGKLNRNGQDVWVMQVAEVLALANQIPMLLLYPSLYFSR